MSQLASLAARKSASMTVCSKHTKNGDGRGVRYPSCNDAYDIRATLEHSIGGIEPLQRDTLLAVATSAGDGNPRVFELLPVGFELPLALAERSDPAVFRESPDVAKVIAQRCEQDLIKVRA
jgi:hypothetical protein